jgi:hypothetical protein
VSTVEVIVGDEIIEVPEGQDVLAFFVHRHREASEQVKAWTVKKAIATAAIMERQPEFKASYETDFGTLVVSRRAEVFQTEIDMEKLLAAEITKAEALVLLSAAKGFDPAKVEKCLGDRDPKKWTPTTRLGKLLKSCMSKKHKSDPFIVVETGTKYA